MSITSEVLCLATPIFFEARDQEITGQEAVAFVKDVKYPILTGATYNVE